MTRIGRHLRGLWVHMPGDLAAEARSRRPVTRNPIPGPVEAELYRACDEKEVARAQ